MASQLGRTNTDAARIAELEAYKQQSLRESAELTRAQNLHHTTISALATQAEFQAMRSAVQRIEVNLKRGPRSRSLSPVRAAPPSRHTQAQPPQHPATQGTTLAHAALARPVEAQQRLRAASPLPRSPSPRRARSPNAFANTYGDHEMLQLAEQRDEARPRRELGHGGAKGYRQGRGASHVNKAGPSRVSYERAPTNSAEEKRRKISFLQKQLAEQEAQVN